jgi:hypothetical protein
LIRSLGKEGKKDTEPEREREWPAHHEGHARETEIHPMGLRVRRDSSSEGTSIWVSSRCSRDSSMEVPFLGLL